MIEEPVWITVKEQTGYPPIVVDVATIEEATSRRLWSHAHDETPARSI